jgi:hypothetical protein
MACLLGGRASYSPGSDRLSREPQAAVILRLRRENEALREEVRQLRAAIHVYSELADRLDVRRRRAARDFHGTL